MTTGRVAHRSRTGATRRRIPIAVALVLGVLIAVGCAPVKLDSTYVGDARSKAYTKAPEPWTVVDIEEQPAISVRGFWAPGGSEKMLLSSSVVPTGVVVRRMPTSEDELDLELLGRQVVFVELESALEQGVASLLEGPTNRKVASLDGEQIVYDLVIKDGTIKVLVEGGGRVRIDGIVERDGALSGVGEPLPAGIVALIAQRSALTVRRLTERGSNVQDEVGDS